VIPDKVRRGKTPGAEVRTTYSVTEKTGDRHQVLQELPKSEGEINWKKDSHESSLGNEGEKRGKSGGLR